MMPSEGKLADEHVEVLGKRDSGHEVDKFIQVHWSGEIERDEKSAILQANTIVSADGMTKCTLCFKRFTTTEFASLHITEKHADRLEEVNVWLVFSRKSKQLATWPSAPRIAFASFSNSLSSYRAHVSYVRFDRNAPFYSSSLCSVSWRLSHSVCRVTHCGALEMLCRMIKSAECNVGESNAA